MATEAHHRRGQHICQLQEVEGHQGGEDDGELDSHVYTHTHTHVRHTHTYKDKAKSDSHLMLA